MATPPKAPKPSKQPPPEPPAVAQPTTPVRAFWAALMTKVTARVSPRSFQRGMRYPLRAFIAVGYRSLWLLLPPMVDRVDSRLLGSVTVPAYAHFLYFAGVCIAATVWVDGTAPDPTPAAQRGSLLLGALAISIPLTLLAGVPWIPLAALAGFWLLDRFVHDQPAPWDRGSHVDATGTPKRPYANEAKALAAARRYERSHPGQPMRSYRCASCPAWHIGPA